MTKLSCLHQKCNTKTIRYRLYDDKIMGIPLIKEYKDDFLIRFPKTKLHAPPRQLLKLDLCKIFVNINCCSVHVYNVHKQYNFTHSFCLGMFKFIFCVKILGFFQIFKFRQTLSQH